MLRIVLGIGWLAGTGWGAVTVSTAPVPPAPAVAFFLDRFGNIYREGALVEPERMFADLGDSGADRTAILILYEPHSFEADRDQLAERLRREFPNRPVRVRALTLGDPYRDLAFPAHSPEVQSRTMDRRRAQWDPLVRRRQQWLEQARSYLAAVTSRFVRMGADLAALRQEYQHLTTQPNGPGPGR